MTYRQELAERANTAVKTGFPGGLVIPTYYKLPCYREFKVDKTDSIFGRQQNKWYCLNFDTSYIDAMLKQNGF